MEKYGRPITEGWVLRWRNFDIEFELTWHPVTLPFRFRKCFCTFSKSRVCLLIKFCRVSSTKKPFCCVHVMGYTSSAMWPSKLPNKHNRFVNKDNSRGAVAGDSVGASNANPKVIATVTRQRRRTQAKHR
jgi:hypothetical protein